MPWLKAIGHSRISSSLCLKPKKHAGESDMMLVIGRIDVAERVLKGIYPTVISCMS